MDGSVIIDYTSANGTKRYIPLPPSKSATTDQKAIALKFSDTYANGTQKAYYYNGTVAIFSSKGALVNYEVPPSWFIGGCSPGTFYDGRQMMDCTIVNLTLQVYYPSLTLKNTEYENATYAMKDEYFKDGYFIRYFRNGTQVKYDKSGQVYMIIIPPTTLAIQPTDYTLKDYSTGERIILYTNGTAVKFNAPI